MLVSKVLLFFCLSWLSTSENVTFVGTIYADNWFQFYFNGEFIIEDPVDWTPHNAVNFTFSAPKDGLYTFAIYTKDYSDNTTGLEYDNQCIDDGGLRAIFTDGTVTIVSNSDWKSYVIYHGPDNYPSCFPSPNDDTTRQNAANCKSLSSSLAGTNCTSTYYTYDSDWYTSGYNDSGWNYSTEYTEDEVGWGQTPSPSSGYLDPQTVSWGDSSFIWGDSLNFDNRLFLRYSFYRNSSSNYTGNAHSSSSGTRDKRISILVLNIIIAIFYIFV